MKKCKVKPSPIHGKGLFALEDIGIGELVGVYEGKLTLKNSRYVLWMSDEDGRFFGIDGTNDMRFMNHSDEPNCTVGTNSPFIYIAKYVKAGDELFIHYTDGTEELEFDEDEEFSPSVAAVA